jgi:predicted PurR-regulated permease PerM
MNTSKNYQILFYAVLAIVTLLFLYLLKPLFPSIFWAAVIASIFGPLYKRLNDKWAHPNINTVIVLLTIAVIIILPAIFIGSLLIGESLQIYDLLNTDSSYIAYIEKIIQGVVGTIKEHPYINKLHINESVLTGKVAEIIKSITNYIFVGLTNLTQNSLAFLIKFVVMFYALFFFVRDGEKFIEKAIRLFPLGNNRETMLYERFSATAQSTLKTTLIIGGIQGILGGFIFYMTGVEGALVWGLIMIFLSVVPMVGCSIVWVPAGIIMLFAGHIWEGIIILAFGVLVISSIDNLLRPLLIGKDVQMHPLLIFLSTLGGISLFGFSGFVLGPIVASLLVAVWDMYEHFS